MIDERLNRALDWIHAAGIDESVRAALAGMATVCAERAA